jgi:hypothetical protein
MLLRENETEANLAALQFPSLAKQGECYEVQLDGSRGMYLLWMPALGRGYLAVSGSFGVWAEGKNPWRCVTNALEFRRAEMEAKQGVCFH